MGILSDYFTKENLSSTLSGIFGGLVGSAALYIGAAYSSLVADASSPSVGFADTASLKAGIGTLDTTAEAAASTSGEDVAAIAAVSPLVLTTSAGIGEASTGGVDEILVLIFKKDAMPYSRIEKRAEQIFSRFSKDNRKAEQFPVIIAESQEINDAFLPIYGNSIKSLKENLEILEAALRNEPSV